jgi:hypothetical protein
MDNDNIEPTFTDDGNLFGIQSDGFISPERSDSTPADPAATPDARPADHEWSPISELQDANIFGSAQDAETWPATAAESGGAEKPQRARRSARRGRPAIRRSVVSRPKPEAARRGTRWRKSGPTHPAARRLAIPAALLVIAASGAIALQTIGGGGHQTPSSTARSARSARASRTVANVPTTAAKRGPTVTRTTGPIHPGRRQGRPSAETGRHRGSAGPAGHRHRTSARPRRRSVDRRTPRAATSPVGVRPTGPAPQQPAASPAPAQPVPSPVPQPSPPAPVTPAPTPVVQPPPSTSPPVQPPTPRTTPVSRSSGGPEFSFER